MSSLEFFHSVFAAGIIVPDNTFLTYMAGQYNNQAEEKFQETKGECVQYVKLQSGNHYAITDWNPDTAPHQARTPPPFPLLCLINALIHAVDVVLYISELFASCLAYSCACSHVAHSLTIPALDQANWTCLPFGNSHSFLTWPKGTKSHKSFACVTDQ